ncbi:hypothetical protein LPJ76_005271 [Coemansia sp. RSA 638]|nr:hypothetical protein LPJ76_005271 [Coemansia sp. RSA 638]
MPPKSRKHVESAGVDAVAQKHWLGKSVKWSTSVVTEIMHTYMGDTARTTVQALERLQYLELYLWPNFARGRASDDYTVSVLLMLNEKHEQGLQSTMWQMFSKDFCELFDDAVNLVMRIMQGAAFETTLDAWTVRSIAVRFLVACFSSIETACVRDACMPLVGVSLWHHVTPLVRERALESVSQLRRFWKHESKKWVPSAKVSEEEAVRRVRDRDFVPELVRDLLRCVREGGHDMFVCGGLELLIDLGSQLATRRYVNLLLDDWKVAELCAHGQHADLAQRLRDTVGFQVRDVTGQTLSASEASDRNYQRLIDLQLKAFEKLPDELDALVVGGAGRLGHPRELSDLLKVLSYEQLLEFAQSVGVRTQNVDGEVYDEEQLRQLFCMHYEARVSVEDRARGMSAYPDEKLLFGSVVTAADAYGRALSLEYPVLALPKLGLQFLSVHDYLLRCFELLRIESASDISADVQDAVGRMQPQATYENSDEVHFEGWTRMALPIKSLTICDVQRPRVGEREPSCVRADLIVDLSGYTDVICAEWDANVRPRDVLILASAQAGGSVAYVRGCKVEARVDDNEGAGERQFRVLLDCAQYAQDVIESKDVYTKLNVAIRRRPQANNFKSVLETVRALMAAPPRVPKWLEPTFLGYGDPSAACPTLASVTVSFGDTFVSVDHVRASFADYAGVDFVDSFTSPCVVEYPADTSGTVRVQNSSEQPRRGSQSNQLEFTPMQVRAIGQAMLPGLTLVVGPPGTGKTDVAVQIVSNLYHAYPRETILLITHSNQALNQLFAKIVDLDIEPRHLLRLGHGEEDLDGDERYSRAGRIDSYLERRTELLARVQRLAETLGVAGDMGYTCETARFFFVAHVRMRWEQYKKNSGEYPFAAYFGEQYVEGQEAQCFDELQGVFNELAEIQPFELLRDHASRADYLLTQQARIVAMTCTHAAMRFGEFQKLGVRFDTIVMEEAAQVLDIETFVPLVLAPNVSRAVLIGDHNQLPPVVKSPGLRMFANMEQSMFARLVRLGVPYVELDRQARARSSIASLYRFRYRNLGDLLPSSSFGSGNKGFKHEFQFVDVGEYNGQGESEPAPHYYQNLGEAEYVVAVYQFMLQMGYAPSQVAILTTYNGQRALLRDVLARRCPDSIPRVSTVDQFQGQQSDIVLLSLVRTTRVGHIRDLRRMTVALSRARLGLYVFGHRSVFESLLFASAIGRVASAVQVVTETRVVTATIVKVASDEYQPFCDDEYDLDDSSDESSARVLGVSAGIASISAAAACLLSLL